MHKTYFCKMEFILSKWILLLQSTFSLILRAFFSFPNECQFIECQFWGKFRYRFRYRSELFYLSLYMGIIKILMGISTSLVLSISCSPITLSISTLMQASIYMHDSIHINSYQNGRNLFHHKSSFDPL